MALLKLNKVLHQREKLHQGTKVGHNMTGPVLPSRITALYTSPLSLRRRFFYPFGVYEPLFHSPTTNVREKNRREWPSVRTHALERGTPSRMRMSRREERERERERDSLGLCLPSSAHPLPFDEDFNLTCAAITATTTDRSPYFCFPRAQNVILTQICILYNWFICV